MNRPDAIYDKNYPYFNETVRRAGNLGYDSRAALRAFLRVSLPLGLKPGNKLLDVGSNIGTLGHYLKFTGVRKIGLDLNLDAISAGRTIYGNEQNNRSLVADGRAIPFESQCFDAIASQDIFEHLPDEINAAQMFEEMNRVLKPYKDMMFHKITVLEDGVNIHADQSHCIKWPTEEWYNFFTSRGWRVLGNPTRHFPIMSSISYGNFLIQREK